MDGSAEEKRIVIRLENAEILEFSCDFKNR